MNEATARNAEDEARMREALAEARAAAQEDEAPVGCIVVDGEGRVAGRGRDGRQGHADPFAHAEVLAIREAAKRQGDWRLDGHTLYVTLEPCPMCAGLILMARVTRVVYGAVSEKWGAAGTKSDLLTGRAFPHRPEVKGGVLAEDSADLLRQYFARRRAAAKTSGGETNG